MGKHSYQVIVTHIELTPLNAWRFYNGRAAVKLTLQWVQTTLIANGVSKHDA